MSSTARCKGLKDLPADQRPPVAIPFFAFRIMVGIGLLMLALVVAGGWLRWRGRLYRRRPGSCAAASSRCRSASSPCIAGWTTTEVGRQPWTVYGLMRTADSVSPSLTGLDVLLSLLGYIVVYLDHLSRPASSLMLRIVRKGPARWPRTTATIEGGRPERRSAPAPSTARGSSADDARSSTSCRSGR